jgi:hypothetical protein
MDRHGPKRDRSKREMQLRHFLSIGCSSVCHSTHFLLRTYYFLTNNS